VIATQRDAKKILKKIENLYVRRYFEGGVSSVFLWDLEDGGFAGVVLLKKSA
jgi:capping protein beta